MKRVTVLYVAGWGRSGSTLLGRMLGSLDGATFAGECNYVWSEGVAQNRVCSCGAPFDGCPFWTSVGDVAFGGWSRDGLGFLAGREEIIRHRHIPQLVARRTPASLEARIEAVGRLYGAIAQTSGASVVVDSAKLAPYAMLLLRSDQLDVRIIQLVRDSRAVAHSWARTKASPDKPGGYMPRVGTTRSSAFWLAEYAIFEMLRKRGIPSSVIRYERFVSDPIRELARSLHELDVTTEGLERLRAGLGTEVSHAFSGNPMRFEPVSFPLREDDEWRAAMPRARQLLAASLTYPLMRRYGYLGGTRRSMT